MKRAILGSLLVVTLVVAVAGCPVVIGGAVAAGGVLYVKGAAQKNYPANVEKTYNAVLAILREDKIVPYKKDHDTTSATIEATLSDGKELKWTLKATGTDVTEVTVRIGTFGDKDRSNYFLGKLDKRLPG